MILAALAAALLTGSLQEVPVAGLRPGESATALPPWE